MSAARKRIGLSVAVLAVLGAALAVLAAGSGHASTAAVTRRDLSLTVPVSGTLEAVHSVLIGPPPIERVWQFKIVMMAPEGSKVAQGEPILAFDASELQKKLIDKKEESAEASEELAKRRHQLAVDHQDDELAIAQAEAALRKADLKADVPSDIVAGRDLEIARLNRKEDEDKVAALKSRLRNAEIAGKAELSALADVASEAARQVAELERDIPRMQVVAPRSGTVIYVSGPTNGGDKYKVGDSVWRGAKILELPDLSEMRGDGFVDEVDAGRLRPGQEVTLHLDAHPEVEYRGRVLSVARTFVRESRTKPRRVVHLKISIKDGQEAGFRPGMRFSGAIEVETLRRVLTVPAAAVVATVSGPRVRVRRDFGWRTVAVNLGERAGGQVQVVDGLREGDRVELAPQQEEER